MRCLYFENSNDDRVEKDHLPTLDRKLGMRFPRLPGSTQTTIIFITMLQAFVGALLRSWRDFHCLVRHNDIAARWEFRLSFHLHSCILVAEESVNRLGHASCYFLWWEELWKSKRVKIEMREKKDTLNAKSRNQNGVCHAARHKKEPTPGKHGAIITRSSKNCRQPR